MRLSLHTVLRGKESMIKLALTMAFLTILSGCTAITPYIVNYKVYPPGGIIFENTPNGPMEIPRYNATTGEADGFYTNQRVVFPATGGECPYRPSVTAVWLSGATATSEVKFCNGPGHYAISLIRPDVPGREVDMEYAQLLTLQANQAAAQAEADRKAARAAIVQRQADIWQAYLSKDNKRTNCTSSVIGNQIHTTCN